MVELEKRLTSTKEDKASISDELTACEARFEEIKSNLAHARETCASADARRRDAEASLTESIARKDAAEALAVSKEAMVTALKEALALSKAEIEVLKQAADGNANHPSLPSDTTASAGRSDMDADVSRVHSDAECSSQSQELAAVKEELEKASTK